MKKRLHLISSLVLSITLLLAFSSVFAQGNNTARPSGTTTSPYGYYEYLPVDYASNTNNYPVLIFLHGRGEMGNGSAEALKEMLLHGPLRETARGKEYPMIIVAPQTPVWWSVDDVHKFVEFTKAKYRTNKDKVYMTGLSMGAIGTFDYANKYPQQLAAMVPIAGKSRIATICNLTSIALWAFHGDADATINETYSIDAVKGYNACLPTPSLLAKITIYPGVGHNSWTKTYDGSAGHDIYKWMLQYSRSSSTTQNVVPNVNAGADKTITLPTNSITVTGAASDTDGTITSTSWTKVTGPACTMNGTTTLSLSLSNLLEGTYTFRLTVKDNAGASKYDDVIVNVNPPATTTANVTPTANAGADKVITLPHNSLSISGTASDSDGTVASTSWTKVSGPACTMNGSTTRTLGLSNLLEGTYTFRFTVKDNAGATKTDDVLVTVKPAPVSTEVNGVSYQLYTTTSSSPWKLLPDFSRLTPVKNGTVANFGLAEKTQSDHFAFVFDAQVQIDVAGTYTFYSNSDDGSQLFINNTLLVNNDGCHAARELSGAVTLTAGRHTIKVTYFDYSGGETLNVAYAGPGIAKQIIPNVKLFPHSTTTSTERTPAAIEAPGSLKATLSSLGTSAYLTWTDYSNNESGFELWMSTGTNSSYKLVASTGADKVYYTKGSLTAGQTYYFKLRAKNSTGFSDWSNEAIAASGTTTSNIQAYLLQADAMQQPATEVTAYPNPATDVVNIRFGSEFQSVVKVRLMDISGKVLYTTNADGMEDSVVQIDINKLQLIKGVYIIRLENENHSKSIRILKN